MEIEEGILLIVLGVPAFAVCLAFVARLFG